MNEQTKAIELRRKKMKYKGYYQSGYGRGFKNSPLIYEIDGKAWAKDLSNYHQVDCVRTMFGYVPVNIINGKAYQCWPDEHKDITS